VVGAAPVVLIRAAPASLSANPVAGRRPGVVSPAGTSSRRDRVPAGTAAAAVEGSAAPARSGYQVSPLCTALQNRSSKRTTRSNACRIAGVGPPGVTASSSPASDATQPAKAGEDQLSTNGQ
jgi:hypothetical protein